MCIKNRNHVYCVIELYHWQVCFLLLPIVSVGRFTGGWKQSYIENFCNCNWGGRYPTQHAQSNYCYRFHDKHNPSTHRMKKCLFPRKQAQFSPIWIVFLCTKRQNFPQIPKFPSTYQYFSGMSFPNSPFFLTMPPLTAMWMNCNSSKFS